MVDKVVLATGAKAVIVSGPNHHPPYIVNGVVIAYTDGMYEIRTREGAYKVHESMVWDEKHLPRIYEIRDHIARAYDRVAEAEGLLNLMSINVRGIDLVSKC